MVLGFGKSTYLGRPLYGPVAEATNLAAAGGKKPGQAGLSKVGPALAGAGSKHLGDGRDHLVDVAGVECGHADAARIHAVHTKLVAQALHLRLAQA